ncbi:glycosyltransferase family 4 protein [Psychroserpens sp. BH13MA-6]
MRIGIDAKWYFNGHPSGKVVVENLVNHLLEMDLLNDYYIYLDKRDKALEFPIQRSNVHLVYVPNKINALTNFLILPFYTKKDNLDICLYQNYTPFWGAKKIVNYVHDALFMDFPEYFSWVERIYFRPMKYLSKFADHVITISHSEKARMIAHGFTKKEHISVVHHGIGLVDSQNNEQDFDKDAFLASYNLPKDFILYLGRLNVRKNIQNLLKAMPDIEKNIALVIVGKDDHKTLDWNLLIEDLDIADRVIKVGFVSHSDIGKFYQMAKVFCFPSYAEGFGLPPLEAMYYGTPTVVSNATSLPEVCEDAALYVDPNKITDIANQVNKLLNDDRLYETMVAKGKARAATFSWKKAAKELLSVLKSV